MPMTTPMTTPSDATIPEAAAPQVHAVLTPTGLTVYSCVPCQALYAPEDALGHLGDVHGLSITAGNEVLLRALVAYTQEQCHGTA